MALTQAAAPPRLTRALESLRRWGEAGVHLVPIRHHSPGCSAALLALLDEVRPSTVLIEGPREYSALLPALADQRTRPPIAVLSIDGDHSAFYPLADFSPEWVALRWGSAHDATVDFIDQSWADQHDDEDPGALVRTLQAEHHLARSAAIARLAAELGCRDHDEVWEHLFELRSPAQFADWREYFGEVLAWAALARLESDRELLDGDGTHAREAVMAAVLERHRTTATGPIVVVTGAFHTLALLEALDDTPEGRWVTRRNPGDLDVPRPAWLIRYDHTRLDGLRGYGAGMPAPGFWQRTWNHRTAADHRSATIDVLLDVATELRAQDEHLSSAEIAAAAEHALGLAALRGRAWPGRTDLTDAMLSCFVRDDSGLSGPLGRAIDKVFGGTALGDLPPGLAVPPLVAEARATALKLRFVVDDGTPRKVSLDTARKPRHVQRREFLATMRFVGSGFARQTGGADLVGGTGLGQLFEEWEYAWTPLVEAALIQVSHQGGTLPEVRRRRIADQLTEQSGSAQGVAQVLAELVAMGATDQLSSALTALQASYDSDASLASVVGSLHRVTGLLAEGGRLALGEHADELRPLLASGLAAAAYLVGPLADVAAADAEPACRAVLSLRELLRRLREGDLAVDAGAPARELTKLRQRPTSARLHGCLVAMAYTDSEIGADELRTEVAAHLHPGADPERLAAFLLGLLQAAPDLILHSPELLDALNDRLAELEPDAFFGILPDLRQAFTWLRPAETAQLAAEIGRRTGATATDLDAVLRFDPALAATAQQLERDLLASLTRDGLTGRPS
ncbi:MAG: DUF5682 family protein [Propionicimonas sp.]